MNYIDAHVHVWTDDIETYPLAPGFKKEDMKPPAFPPEEALAHARPCGVDRIVLIQMSYYRFDNTCMLEAMREYEGVKAVRYVIRNSNRKKHVTGVILTAGIYPIIA